MSHERVPQQITHPLRAFTLIELSTVLVIIGLVVGGILVGRDLIDAAYARSTLTQIEKYTQAANTFRSKYDYWPGDIPAPYATQFGFVARGSYLGWGDGNGLIQGATSGGGNYNNGVVPTSGETAVFWTDLTTAKLIEDKVDAANFGSPTLNFYPTSTDPSGRLPPAKIGSGNYIYVFSGQSSSTLIPNQELSYFGLSVITTMPTGNWTLSTTPGLKVKLAQMMDAKMDDGLPQSGRTVAFYYNNSMNAYNPSWAAGGGAEGANSSRLPTTAAVAGSATTCYDNNSSAGAAQQYSVTQNNGNGINCALSFRFK